MGKLEGGEGTGRRRGRRRRRRRRRGMGRGRGRRVESRRQLYNLSIFCCPSGVLSEINQLAPSTGLTHSKVGLAANVCLAVRIHQLPCDAKVTELDLSFMVDEYVGGLHI